MEPGGAHESLIAALNHDALEEVFVHCAPADLLALRQTCAAAAHLLTHSEKVWLAKLRESFGLGLKVGGGCGGRWGGWPGGRVLRRGQWRQATVGREAHGAASLPRYAPMPQCCSLAPAAPADAGPRRRRPVCAAGAAGVRGAA